jgi:hypothetical protein
MTFVRLGIKLPEALLHAAEAADPATDAKVRTRKSTMMSKRVVFALALLTCTLGPAEAASDAPVTYRAIYRVEYRGRESGKAEISVSRHSAEARYQYTSVMQMTGAAKLLVPGEVTERSTFVYDHGNITPLEFSYEDGRDGDDNLHAVFDWDRNVAVTTTGTGKTELAVPAGTLDVGSLQVALMNDLETGGRSALEYQIAVGDRLQKHEFEFAETAAVDTGVGHLSAQRLVQRRLGASRTLALWMAPSLSFLPVRIEHQKNGETETSLVLESVDGIAPRVAAP